MPVGGDTGRRLLAIDLRMATLAAQRTELLTGLRHEAAATPAVPPGPAAPPSPPAPPAPAGDGTDAVQRA